MRRHRRPGQSHRRQRWCCNRRDFFASAHRPVELPRRQHFAPNGMLHQEIFQSVADAAAILRPFDQPLIEDDADANVAAFERDPPAPPAIADDVIRGRAANAVNGTEPTADIFRRARGYPSPSRLSSATRRPRWDARCSISTNLLFAPGVRPRRRHRQPSVRELFFVPSPLRRVIVCSPPGASCNIDHAGRPKKFAPARRRAGALPRRRRRDRADRRAAGPGTARPVRSLPRAISTSSIREPETQPLLHQMRLVQILRQPQNAPHEIGADLDGRLADAARERCDFSTIKTRISGFC